MPPRNSTASKYSVHLLVLKANASAILLYAPECMERPSEEPHERAKRLTIMRLIAT